MKSDYSQCAVALRDKAAYLPTARAWHVLTRLWILSSYLSQESSKTEWMPLLESLFVTLPLYDIIINTALL